MHTLPSCPKCTAADTYKDGALLVCPMCGHEWSPASVASALPGAADGDADGAEETAVRDANGNILQTGDSVVVIKDLKVKGSSLVVKAGTKVKNIRLVDGDHDIDCKIDGIGAMGLKSEFVRKA
jgi:protein PhnA